MKTKYIIFSLLATFLISCYFLLNAYIFDETWNLATRVAIIIFLLTAFLWITEIIPLYVTSFLILLLELTVLFPIMKGEGIDTVSKKEFFAPFFSDIILLFMGGFVLSDLLNRYSISRRITSMILGSRSWKPANFILIIMVITAFFSMWISNTATAAMLLALVSPIIASPDAHPNVKRLLPISIAFAANIGGLGTPIGTPPNAIALGFLSRQDYHISFFTWMLMMIPYVVVLLIFIWQVLIRLYPVTEITHLEESKIVQMTKVQKVVLGIFFATVLAWITTGIHPLSTGEISLTMMIVVFGFNFLSRDDFNKLSWHILIILGGGMALGIAVSESGLAKKVVDFIPLDSSNNVIISVIIALSSTLTTFINNTAAANLIVPLSIHLKDLAIPAVLATTVMCSTNMALSISTPPNVLAFGMGNLTFKDLFVPGIIISAFSMITLWFLLIYTQLILGY